MKILTIVKNTYKEAVRSKLFLLLTIFSFAIIIASKVISMLVVSSGIRVIMDMGLATIELFSILTAVLIAVNLFYKEKERRTLFNILSKPVSREEFIIGKFLGISAVLFVSISVLGTVFLLYLWIVSGKFSFYLIYQMFFSFLVGNILIAFSLLFSTLSTPILSSIFSFGIYVIGSFTPTLITYYQAKFHGISLIILKIIYYLLPNLTILNWKNKIIHSQAIPFDNFITGAIYGIDYILIVVVLTIIIFKNKEIN
jgi:ABC-type transport system involved in multi-copper enzyme maturation permease subunit